jgi:hypothetical protein
MVAAEAGKAPRTYVLTLDGTAPRAFGPEGFGGTTVSPDGKYVVGRKDNAFWMVPLAGDQTPQPLPFVRDDEGVLGWTTDSGSIYVSDVSSIPVKVYIVDVKSGQRRLHHQAAPGDLSGVSNIRPGHMTPDGTFYTYGVSRTLSFLYVVEGLK